MEQAELQAGGGLCYVGCLSYSQGDTAAAAPAEPDVSLNSQKKTTETAKGSKKKMEEMRKKKKADAAAAEKSDTVAAGLGAKTEKKRRYSILGGRRGSKAVQTAAAAAAAAAEAAEAAEAAAADDGRPSAEEMDLYFEVALMQDGLSGENSPSGGAAICAPPRIFPQRNSHGKQIHTGWCTNIS
jgi:hypothetical protein